MFIFIILETARTISPTILGLSTLISSILALSLVNEEDEESDLQNRARTPTKLIVCFTPIVFGVWSFYPPPPPPPLILFSPSLFLVVGLVSFGLVWLVCGDSILSHYLSNTQTFGRDCVQVYFFLYRVFGNGQINILLFPHTTTTTLFVCDTLPLSNLAFSLPFDIYNIYSSSNHARNNTP